MMIIFTRSLIGKHLYPVANVDLLSYHLRRFILGTASNVLAPCQSPKNVIILKEITDENK